jgi:16S rRNA (cytidine1402-2'-O)-methyltransferase
MNVDETRPEGQLVLVATPLGNLGDLSPRALEFFRRADVIYCEDTRHSRVLFSANGIASGGRLQALHEHNEVAQSEHVVTRVREGQLVVLISDAGTPGISDPGTRVVAAVATAGLRVSTAPGPSAVVAALSISGLPTERFIMEGFFPRKANDRARLVASWAEEERTIVFYESPQRLAGVLSELAQTFPDRRVAVVRELTKLHEEVIRGTTREVAAVLEQRVILGEIVVVLEGGEPVIDVDDELVRRALREQFSSGVSTRDAVDFVSETLGASHRVVYQMALEVKKDATS